MASRSLVFEGDVLEEVGHGLFVVYAAYGLGQEDADVHGFYFVALHLLQLVGNRVGYDDLKVEKVENLTENISSGWKQNFHVRN